MKSWGMEMNPAGGAGGGRVQPRIRGWRSAAIGPRLFRAAPPHSQQPIPQAAAQSASRVLAGPRRAAPLTRVPQFVAVVDGQRGAREVHPCSPDGRSRIQQPPRRGQHLVLQGRQDRRCAA